MPVSTTATFTPVTEPRPSPERAEDLSASTRSAHSGRHWRRVMSVAVRQGGDAGAAASPPGLTVRVAGPVERPCSVVWR